MIEVSPWYAEDDPVGIRPDRVSESFLCVRSLCFYYCIYLHVFLFWGAKAKLFTIFHLMLSLALNGSVYFPERGYQSVRTC